jgi:DNA-binding YbaB/EbfC family protein
MKNFGNILKQAQQMQAKMAEVQRQLESLEIKGNSGGGMVEVVLSGKGDLISIKIDPSIVDPKEADVLEDLITAAFNDAKKKVEEASNAAMSKVTGGMGLPPGLGF